MDELLQLPAGHLRHHIHNEYSQSLSPAAATYRENEVLIPFTGDWTQVTIPSHYLPYQKKNDADPELA